MRKRQTIEVNLRYEMAHRLFGGKDAESMPTRCRSLHGHSWKFVFVFEVFSTVHGISVDFGVIKSKLREALDKYDHCVLLEFRDPLGDILSALPEMRVVRLMDEPTTEYMAKMLFNDCRGLFSEYVERLALVGVRVHETETNTATYGEL